MPGCCIDTCSSSPRNRPNLHLQSKGRSTLVADVCQMYGGSFENECILGRAGTVWRSPRMVDATDSSAKLREVAKRVREKRIGERVVNGVRS